jgi:glycosyltransferase involved in cell wall biosynthesis
LNKKLNLKTILQTFYNINKKSVSRMNTKIKIAIDTIFFTNHSYSGISRVWESILTNLTIPELVNHEQSNYEIILLIRGKTNEILKKINSQNKYCEIIIRDFNYQIMYQDVDYLNYICKQNNIQYFISTYYTYCTAVPNILMIHDMIPEIFNFPFDEIWIQKDLAIKNASQFIAVSKNTSKDLTKFYPYIKDNNYNITVIYNSIQNTKNSANTSTNADIYDDNFLKNVLIQNGILPKQYIFAMATNNEKYKNINLITNFATKYQNQLSQKLNNKIPIILLIKQQFPNGYAVSNGVLYLSNVSNQILNTLYKNALCYINSSLYEGFGLPVFEAFAHKTPVIAISQPIYQELAANAINFIENDIDELFDKVCFIHKNVGNPSHMVNKRIENGYTLLANYTPENQTLALHQLLNSLSETPCLPFLNIIFQSYNETNPERRKELEYCMQANLDNPYIAKVHDFGYQSEKYLPEAILKHPKYILVSQSQSTTDTGNTWLTYEQAFKYSNLLENTVKYGSYWGIVNCDIFLDNSSPWQLIRGRLNSDYVYAQSRNEFNILANGEKEFKMDANFARLYHANTQDAWFYKAPIILPQAGQLYKMDGVNFELGMLGCDNAIADRLVQSGYKVINQPETFKIMHYDIAKGKNSTNYLEKHTAEVKAKGSSKPANKHPERKGSYLVPNYDQLLGNNFDIDLISIINGLGGLSNWERYKIISELLSSRVRITNPD